MDLNDQVIDRKPRSVVHREQLLHRAVHIFVFRPTGEMLIHKRSPTKEEFPSVWTSSASGHVSSNETYDESAPRELEEELGIQAELTRRAKFAACAETSWEFTVLYTTTTEATIHFDPVEMTEVRWLFPSQIEAWLNATPSDFSPAFALLFRWLQQ